MDRRQFLHTLGAGVLAAGFPARATAQNARPKIMLFGLTAITQNGTAIETVLPAVSNHGSFISGPSKLIALLANGRKPMPAAGSGVDDGHDDLGNATDALVCLGDHHVTVGSGLSRLQAGLGNHLPNVPQLAAQMQPGPNYAFGPYPLGTIKVSLGGGTLRMPGKPSNNVGTHNVAWQFHHNQQPVGADYRLTDLLVFEADGPSLSLAIGPSKATLGSGDQLWFVNIPTFAIPDTTQSTIEHAHDWFSFLNSTVSGTIVAVTKSSIARKTGTRQLNHPCADTNAPQRLRQAAPSVRYFPPDTDPCFIVMA